MQQLPPPVLNGIVEAFSRSVELAWLVAVPICLGGFLLSWLLREEPLRESAPMSEERVDGTEIVAEPLG
jgi:hypothetical protein